jgi:hypothetical protein
MHTRTFSDEEWKRRVIIIDEEGNAYMRQAEKICRKIKCILDIYKVFEPLVCCLKGIWLHPYTITPAKLALDLGSQGHLWSENDATTSWLRLISTSDHFIHPY